MANQYEQTVVATYQTLITNIRNEIDAFTNLKGDRPDCLIIGWETYEQVRAYYVAKNALSSGVTSYLDVTEFDSIPIYIDPIYPCRYACGKSPAAMHDPSLPRIGSRWLNTKTEAIYEVVGYGLDADADFDGLTQQIIYRSNSMPEERYWFRSKESWYGQNSKGQPRFIPVESDA